MFKFLTVFLALALLFSGAEAVPAKPINPTGYNSLALVREKAKKSRSRTGARTRKKAAPRTGARTPNSDWERAIRTGARGVVVYPNSELNPIEKAQLLAGHSDAEIRLALAIRFLELWTDEELQAEIAARAARKKD